MKEDALTAAAEKHSKVEALQERTMAAVKQVDSEMLCHAYMLTHLIQTVA